jgi:RNA polymerase sigma-70 factor, ECF subfamily
LASEITVLLRRWSGGDAAALGTVTELVYPELRRIAVGYLRREDDGHVLQPTALINEVYLRLASLCGIEFNDRKHFLALVARMMRQILIDHARNVHAARRGGGAVQVSLDDRSSGVQPATVTQRGVDFILLDAALTALGEFDERKARLLELRYFGGMSVQETAEVLGISSATVSREQRVAEAWLSQRMSAGADAGLS